MQRVLILAVGLVVGWMAARWLTFEPRMSPPVPVTCPIPTSGQLAGSAEAAEPRLKRQATLDQLCQGNMKVLDLAWPLNKDSAYWPGPKYEPFELKTLATLDKDGVLSKAFCTPEHLGTHLDAPNHFEARGVSVDQLRPEQFFAPGVLIDVSAAAAMDADYRLRLEDVKQWEAAHGPIPRGAVVLLHTGWGRHWNHPDRYQGADVMGRLHFPGFSAPAVKYLLAERDVRGIGLDTLSVDYGLSRDFEVHHLLGAAGRYGLENLAHLGELPPRDFYLVVAPIKIETGSGGPARVFAILP